jgi:hypothetical protein
MQTALQATPQKQSTTNDHQEAGVPVGWTIKRTDGSEILVVAPSGNGTHLAGTGTLAARLLYELAATLIGQAAGPRCTCHARSAAGDGDVRGLQPAESLGLAQLTLTGKQIRQLVAIEAGADDEVTIAFAGPQAPFGAGIYACGTARRGAAPVPLFDREG